MIEEQINQILNELGDGTYIFIAKINPEGGITTIIRWRKLSEAMIISSLEKAKFDLLAEINRRQDQFFDKGER